MMKPFKMEPISATQLVDDIKGIYRELVLLESKVAEVDAAQSTSQQAKLTRAQWQALVNLHRTLLYEHHDFLVASNHPSSTVAMQKLSIEYAMPARLWRYGIHSFLELLRHRLPDSHEFMLTFIYFAYGILALLCEKIPAHEETWMECLGDLSRYRMAIEETDISVRETWTNISRGWYQLASDRMPSVGRLYHHVAILARPYALQQLFYFLKSLSVAIPFPGARNSILWLFDPLIDGARVRYDAVDIATYTGISLACAMLGYGAEGDFVLRTITKHHIEADARKLQTRPSETFKQALGLTIKVYSIAVKHWDDPNTLSFTHVIFVFLWQMTSHPSIMEHIEEEFPWKLTALMLNFHIRYRKEKLAFAPECPICPATSSTNKNRPLPEDFCMREIAFSQDYYPPEFFKVQDLEEVEKSFETDSMEEVRKQRLLVLGRRIAEMEKWLTWSEETKSFGVTKQFSGLEDVDVGIDVVQPVDFVDTINRGEVGFAKPPDPPMRDPEDDDIGESR
ncbi:hypothetical protein N3K66_009085 [Trichothecium roseum]|uniref:Uncharacterized protein n=1 Tax=Trichothecium roseum TaxID=47278 RepID=A0ACC0UPM9_9HYPO|nr:hypothetical protein N3K66_009085 [Trichothecium roseum]